NLLFPPPPVEDTAGMEVDSLAAPVATVAPSVPAATPAIAAAAAADTVHVSSELYRYGFSTRGGSLVRAELLAYPSYTNPGEAVQLAPEAVQPFLSYRLVVDGDTIPLADADFTASAAAVTVSDGQDGVRTLQFIYADSAGFGVELTYGFRPDRY